jgi:hypothetical protein
MSDDFIDDILQREGVPRNARLRVNVVARRVRVTPDGTRHVVSETYYPQGMLPRKRTRAWWFALVCALVGGGQLAYGTWAGRSDLAAAKVFRADPSCSTRWIDPQQPPGAAPVGACRVDTATIVERHIQYHRRGGPDYWLVTVTRDGTRDDSPILWRGQSLWDRVSPTQRIRAQRFVARGYHLSGSITAFADDTGLSLTWYHPDSGTHLQFVNVLLGGAILVTGLLLLYRIQNRIRQDPVR